MVSKLDFSIIDTHNFKTLGIVDTSWYNPLIKIESPIVEILAPGFKYFASPFFMTKALNIYNSNGLGLTKASCEGDLIDLPDGIWKVKYSICPNDKLYIQRYFLKTDKLQCKFTQAFLNLDLSDISNESQIKKMKILDEVEIFIEGAIASSNNQNIKLSTDLYKKADNILSKYIESNMNGSCDC